MLDELLLFEDYSVHNPLVIVKFGLQLKHPKGVHIKQFTSYCVPFIY